MRITSIHFDFVEYLVLFIPEHFIYTQIDDWMLVDWYTFFVLYNGFLSSLFVKVKFLEGNE